MIAHRGDIGQGDSQSMAVFDDPIELARGKLGEPQCILAHLSLARPFEFDLVVSLDCQRWQDRHKDEGE